MSQKTYQTTLLIRGDSKNAVKSVKLTRDELEKLTGAQRKNQSMTDRLRSSFDRANKSVAKSTTGFGALRGLIATVGTGKLISETLRASDAYTSMQGQLRLVTDSQKQLNEVYQASLEISNDTGIATEATVNLYSRLARSTEELNLGQDKLLSITEAVNRSFVVSNATSEEAASVSLQLAQGLASGALAGDELKSVMEGNSYLTGLLTEALGINRGELKQWGKDGKLSAELVSNAILSMSDQVEADFEAMPVTIGRVWQAITNDLNDSIGNIDSSELTGSLEELREEISSPQFKEGIASLAAGLLKVVTTGAQATVTLTGLTKFLGEEFAARVGGAAINDIPRLEKELEKAEKRFKRLEGNIFATSKATIEASAKVLELRDRLKLARELQEEFGKKTDVTTESVREESKQIGLLSEIVVTAKKKKESYKDTTNSVVRALSNEIEMLRLSEREQFIFNETQKAGIAIGAENEARIRGIAGELYDLVEAREADAKAADEQAKANEKAAKETEKAWSNARSTLSDFFFELASDGMSAFDTLENGFKAMIQKMIAEAATNQILLTVGSAIGGDLGSAISGSAQGFGSQGNLLGSAKSLLGAGAGGGSGAGLGASAASLAGYAAIAAAAYQSYSDISAGKYDLGDVANGNWLEKGGYADNLNGFLGIEGKLSEFALKGLTGNPFGIFDKSVGKVFGSIGGAIGLSGKNNGNDQGFTEFDFGTGQRNSEGVGGNFDQANVDGSSAFVDALQAFTESIGGSTYSGRVEFGNQRGISIIGEGEFGSDYEAALAHSFREIVKEATNVDEALKPLIIGFEGTGEQIAMFASSMAGLANSSQINSVTAAIEDFARVQPSISVAYERQTALVQQLIDDYDGSAVASAALNQQVELNKEGAYQLASALQQSGAQLRSLADSQSEYFRQSILTEDELREARTAERDTLAETLRSITDPTEIAETQAKILQLNRQVFDSLSEEQRLAQFESFATLAENTTQYAESFLSESVLNMQATQEDINRQIVDLQRELIQQQQENTTAFTNGVAQFGQFVSQFGDIDLSLFAARPSELLT